MAQGKGVFENIADSKDQEQVLKGIQPKHQICFKVFKVCIFLGIFAAVLAGIAFGLTFVPTFKFITGTAIYRKYFFGGLIVLALILALIAVVDKLLFLI